MIASTSEQQVLPAGQDDKVEDVAADVRGGPFMTVSSSWVGKKDA
jgi:hypothetical protein